MLRRGAGAGRDAGGPVGRAHEDNQLGQVEAGAAAQWLGGRVGRQTKTSCHSRRSFCLEVVLLSTVLSAASSLVQTDDVGNYVRDLLLSEHTLVPPGRHHSGGHIALGARPMLDEKINVGGKGMIIRAHQGVVDGI